MGTSSCSTATTPVWDYALVIEPLSDGQRASIDWHDRHGIADAGNLFHYYRLTDDNRILWGGYDAVSRFGGGTDERHLRDQEAFERLAEHFFATFPDSMVCGSHMPGVA